jgi:hypothetical protein
MLASLLAAIASGEALASVRRAKLAAIIYAIVLLLAALGLGFLILAGYLYAAAHYGTIEAAVGFGAAFLILSLFVLLVFKLTAGARARREAQRRKSELATVAAASALAILPALASRKSGLGLVLAPLLAAVGYQILKENQRKPPGPPADE